MNASNSILNLFPITPSANLYHTSNPSPPPFSKIKSRSMGSLAAKKQEEPFYLKLSLPRPYNKQKHRQIDPSPRKKMQEMLSSNYDSQILQKKNDFASEERKRISDQRKYLSDIKSHSNFEASLSLRQRVDYSRQLQDEIRSRKVLSQQAQSQQKKPIKLRQLGTIHKAEAFKNFYEHAYSYRERVAQEYQHYMEGEKTYENIRNKKALLNLEARCKQPSELIKAQERMKRNDRDSLRHILEHQIEEQRRQKQRKLVSYESVKTQGYHPILNPIDFKLDMKNKYVLRQILSQHQY